jgi:nucleoside-diphosphate-sugar epimerase
MNLAPVEQYFSDFLSILETRLWTKSGEEFDYSCDALLNSKLIYEGGTQLRNDLVELELNEWKIFLKSCGSYLQSNQSIIFLSSGGCIYTAGAQSFSEEDEAFGANQYGRLKIAMENELIKSGLPNSILRVANVYGPNQPYGRGQGVIAEWIHSIQNSKEIRVYGELNSFRDYLFIEDLCFAIQLVIEHEGLEKIFNETYFDGFKFIKRPLEKCLNSRQAHCIGMPSGHSETITIFASLLYLYKFGKNPLQGSVAWAVTSSTS